MTGAREVILVVVSQVPLLLLRLGMSLLGMAFRRERGAASFRRTLKSRGIDAVLARRLTNFYRSQLSVRQLIRTVIRSAR